MSKFTEYIGSQFGNPRGFIGKVCCIMMNVINKPMYRKVVSTIDANEQSEILDIGYGNGYLISLLFRRYCAEIYGIDISDDMKAHAAKRNRKGIAAGKVHLETGSCCELQYENDSFDAVTSINTIYFWEDTVKGLQEIRRVLKDGGAFYNVVYTKEWLQKLSYTKKGFRLFEEEDFHRLGTEAGFSDISVAVIAKNKSFAVIYRK